MIIEMNKIFTCSYLLLPRWMLNTIVVELNLVIGFYIMLHNRHDECTVWHDNNDDIHDMLLVKVKKLCPFDIRVAEKIVKILTIYMF